VLASNRHHHLFARARRHKQRQTDDSIVPIADNKCEAVQSATK